VAVAASENPSSRDLLNHRELHLEPIAGNQQAAIHTADQPDATMKCEDLRPEGKRRRKEACRQIRMGPFSPSFCNLMNRTIWGDAMDGDGKWAKHVCNGR